MAGKVTTQLVIEGQDKTKAAFGQVDKSLGMLGTAAKAAGAAIAGALTVDAFAGWIKGASDAAAQMESLARLSNSTAEVMSVWGHAAKSVGVEQDKLGDIFKDVQDKVGDFLATGGGEMKDFFEQVAPKVGVTAEQFRHLSGPDALQLYVSTLEKANLSNSEMIFYLESIADDATLLLPLLENNAAGLNKMAAEAEALGIVVGSKTAQEAKEFNRQLDELAAVGGSVGNMVTTEMLPAMNSLLGMFVSFVKESQLAALAAGVISTALKLLGTPVIIIGGALKVLGQTIGGVAAAAVAAAKGDFSEAKNILQDVATEAERLSGATLRELSGLWEGGAEAVGMAAAEQGRHLSAMQANMAEHAKVMTREHGRLTDAIKKQIADQTSAEKQALSDLERIKRDRLAMEQRYADAIAKFSGAGSGGASFGAYQQLRLNAQEALRAGDAETARKQAQAALQMLEELAAAGESTYGFEGMAKGLRDIEDAAFGLEKSEADRKLEVIAINLAMLKAQADELKKVEITPSLSPEAAQAAKSQMEALAAQLGITMTIPVIPVVQPVQGALPTNTVPGDPDVPMPGYATGGMVSGPGSGTSDSILARLSNGEFVMRAAAVQHYGPALLAAMNGLQLPRFADGGLVGSLEPSMPHLGSLDLNLGGQTTTVYVESGGALDLRRLAMKKGRTQR